MYRSIETKIWADPKFKNLVPEDKLLFLYFITNQHTHLSGLYYIPEPLVLFETGISKIGYRKGIDTLSMGGLCRFDTTNSVIWVINMLKYQGRGAKIDKSVETQIMNLHDSPLIPDFIEYYGFKNIPYRYPVDTPSIPHRHQEQEQEQEQEQDKDIGQISKKPNPKKTKSLLGFNEFWSQYPKKVAKGQAEKAWLKIKPDQQLLQKIIEQTKKYTSFVSKNGNMEYCKHPATWLNAKCWEDENIDPIEMQRVRFECGHARNVRKYDGEEKFIKYLAENKITMEQFEQWITDN